MKYAFFFLSVVMVALSAVTHFLEPEDVQDGKTVLTYACVEFKAKREQVALFNRLHPHYEVRIDTGNTKMEKKIIQSLAGIGPDLFNSHTPFQSSGYIKAGIAWDITDELAERGIDVEKQVWKAAHTYVVQDGRVYGFPYAAHADSLYYNKAIFERCGVPFPKELVLGEELLSLARKLTVRDEGGRIRHFGFLFRWGAWQEFMRQWGGRIYSEDGTRCVLDSPETVAAIQFMQNLVWKHKVSPSPEQESGMATTGGWGSGTVTWFGGGRAAMALGGRYWLVVLRDRENYPDLRMGVAELQCGPHRTHRGYAGCIMINRQSPRREHALNYLCYMAGREYNELVCSQADGLGPVKKFCYTEGFLFNPVYPKEKYNHVWRDVLAHAVGDDVSPFVNGHVAMRIVGVQMDLVKRNSKTAEEAMRKAAGEINEEIEKNLARDPKLKALYEERTAGREGTR